MVLCDQWNLSRPRLRAGLGLFPGGDVSVEEVIEKALEAPEKWRSFRDFCREVLLKKQEYERKIERGEILETEDLIRGHSLK